MSKEKKLGLEKQMNEMDEMERKALRRIHSDKGRLELKAQTAAMKEMIRNIYNWE